MHYPVMPSLFVTGAGTDIGKTYVCCLLLRQLARQGITMHPLKPVLSGAEPQHLENSDIGQLLLAAGLPLTEEHLARHCPWRFDAPLAPPMAAARESASLHFDDIATYCDRFLADAPLPTLLEGAGGVMSPLTQRTTSLDLMRHLKLPILFVMGSYLGAITHALTGLQVLAQSGLNVALTVISQSETSPMPLAEVAEAMQRHSPYPTPVLTLHRLPLDLAMQSTEDMGDAILRSHP